MPCATTLPTLRASTSIVVNSFLRGSILMSTVFDKISEGGVLQKISFGMAHLPNFGCIRGTKNRFLDFLAENSPLQPLFLPWCTLLYSHYTHLYLSHWICNHTWISSNNVLFCMSCYYHSHLIIPYLAQILGFWVACGVKMMSLCHGWGWQTHQTAFHIHIRHISWLPYPQNHITGNALYGTGNAIHIGNVSCPYRYCTPLYFMFFLANPLRYVPIQSTGTVIPM